MTQDYQSQGFAAQDFSSQDLEHARKLFAGPCDFMLGVAGLNQLPDASLPEVAFAGRSNVGKSSLLNALTNRKTLAKTSATPGRTQQLNYFNLGNAMHIVDLPGYGYAKVSKTQRDAWTQLIFDFLRGRQTLRCVFILIDARHGLKDSDIVLMDMLDEAAVTYRVIFTKADKAKKQELIDLSQQTLDVVKKHAAAFPGIHATSSIKNIGLDAFKAIISSYQ